MECTIFTTVKEIGVSQKMIREAVLLVLTKVKKKNAAVSIHFIGDRQMHRLNKEHRGKDKVTDVLSFAMQEGEKWQGSFEQETDDWGDIFICVPQIKRQAKEYRVTYREELMRMTVHGVLHLLGYDHEKDSDARIMFPLQDKLVVACMKK